MNPGPTPTAQRLKRCRRCHRELKDPESIKLGIGPVCALKEHELQLELFGGTMMSYDPHDEDVISEDDEHNVVVEVIWKRLEEMKREETRQ